MSTTNPLEQAAIPSALVALKATQTLIATLTSTAPTNLPLVVPGALQVFLGTVELQAPTLASSELSAVGQVANSTIGGWITKLEAAQAATTSTTTTSTNTTAS